ncbi:hypothetical protein MJO28_003232 [Puccinia striiformis f. sp. tritici]|nr:hypothetical protein Pst134EA_004858 [Puccinia striiformis f. sp. tritici]KNE97897.1 hypothetical protein PSTG_08770 [Puccinia striiformis f. sp. tritici PST-78]POW11830.1 hypothetical protein PSHT_08305 [Puccinia striiformis]KAH9470947.1 hypothetical protein Pst134EA_004858 [Puccinia striiformis f. sp. tritici]KAI7959441.1 hypothetical protein MJO28_003232 [Puccinia striiformis f. sp. tritici]KAI7965197.1 hypothetical protein MJO29_003295 [Puccinia striiformis f. sp. tritici]
MDEQRRTRGLVDQRTNLIKRFILDGCLSRQPVKPSLVDSVDSKSTAVDSISVSGESDHRSISTRTATSLSSFSLADHHPICYQPPSLPPRSCPLPSLPADRLSSSRSAFSPSPITGCTNHLRLARSKSGLCLSPRHRHHPLPNPPQLQSKASLQHVHQGTAYRQAPQPVTGSFDDENEQKTVVSRTHHTQPNVGWSANDPLNPLSPATRRVSRPESVDTTASQSYYSINATINSRIFPSSSSSSSSSSFSGGGFVYGTIPSTQGPPTLVSTSGESQEMVITPSTSVENEDLSNVQYPQLHRLMITSPEVLFYKDLQFNSRPSPLAETFSFGSLSRFDGFFFGSRHRLDQRYHPGSALILKVSPPISSTTFSPGESIFFKILLENPFDHIFVSFVGESRLVGEQKLRSHRFLKHEISIDSPGKNGCWEVHEGSSSKEWLVHLKIPKFSNCDCKGELDRNHFGESEIPSSTTNKHVFIAYHLIIRGIGKQKKSDNSKRSDKDKQTNKTKVKKSKGSEERVRLTVKVKKQTSPPNNNNNDRVDENIWIAGEHNYSCVSID